MTYATTTQLNAEIARAKAAEAKLQAQLDALKPAPAPSTVLLDTRVTGWGGCEPLDYYQATLGSPYDPGDKQDGDAGRSLAHCVFDAAKGLTITAKREAGGFVDTNTGTARPYGTARVGWVNAFSFGPSANGTRLTFGGVVWPAVQGGFFALWTLAAGKRTTPPEVDLVEAVTGTKSGNGPNLVTTTNHTVAGPEIVNGLPYIPATGAWAGTPHDWSMTLYPDHIDCAVDGKVYGTFHVVPAAKLYPIIECNLGGPAYQVPPTPYRVDSTTPVSVALTVAYVKVETL